MEGLRQTTRIRLFPLIVLVAILSLIFLFRPKAASKDNLPTQPQLGSVAINLPPLAKTPLPALPELVPNPSDPQLATHAALLLDADSGTVLYSDRPNAVIPIASTTKLMTAVVVRSQLELDQVVTISQAYTEVIGSDMQLRPGEKITVRSLLNGLLMASGNDAAVTLAETVAGGKTRFIELMNQKAQDLGMKNTLYRDPAGLDDEGHSSAYDLSIIARAALADPMLAEIMRANQRTVTSTDGRVTHELKNSNRLVGEYQYPGALGFKTGFTPAAGHCLVAGAERSGHTLIAIILRTNTDTITASADEARKLLDWGWQNAVWQ